LKLPKYSVIQAGVENIELINGKKFTARIYVLLWNGQVYLFDDGFALIHGPQYQRGSTQYGVQVDHRGYQTGVGEVDMKLFSETSCFAKSMPKAKAALRQILPIFQNTLNATSTKRYLLLGIDLLPLENGAVKFVEINAIPNFVHSQRINQQLNVHFFKHVMRVIYGLDSNRLLKVQPAVSPRVFVIKRT
ncbi:MAG: tubulin--tyrosine ligase family protein, partial [Symploca sp. SIO2G7]|nr:tubulin--tyrosine ligase family protein [Symploca sp. SIO2G7]